MLHDDDISALREIIKRLYEPSVDKAAAQSKRPSTIATAFLRGQVRYVFKNMGDAAMNYDALDDARAKPYRVTVQIWDTAGGEDRGELVGETDPETVAGLAAVCGAIEAAVCELHEEPRETAPCGAGPLIQRLPTFRTILSRNGGEAIMRARYEYGGAPHLVTARVERADVIAARDSSGESSQDAEARRKAALDKLRAGAA